MNNIFRLSLHNSWDSNKRIIIKRHSLTLSWLLGLCVAHINVTYLWTYYHCWYKFKFIIFPLLSSLCCLLIKLNYYHSLSNAEVVKACSTLWSITVYSYIPTPHTAKVKVMTLWCFSLLINKEGVFISSHCRKEYNYIVLPFFRSSQSVLVYICWTNLR